MGPKFALFLAALLVVADAEAHPRIYMFVDADGSKHYTDVPDSNRYKLLMLSTDELTRSGDHYNAAVIAKAAQYDAIIERVALAAAVEPNLLRAVIVVDDDINVYDDGDVLWAIGTRFDATRDLTIVQGWSGPGGRYGC